MASPEQTYRGPVGKTRRESVHVTIPGGHVRSVEVYVAVDVQADPKLKDAALAGALHRFEGGEELAIPFVYHDPAARKLALVIPETLRHRELLERARFFERLAEDTEHEIPTYVRAATVVIGPKELAEYLEAEGEASADAARHQRDFDARDRELAAREAAIATREAALQKKDEKLFEREARLKTRAEEVTRQEDEVRSATEIVEARQREIDLSEEELVRRLAEVRAREERVRAGGGAKQPAASPVATEAAPAEAVEAEEIEEIEPLSTSEIEPMAVEPTKVRSAEDVELAASVEELGEEVEEIIDEDDVEELDESDMIQEVTGVTSNPASPSDVPSAVDQSGSHPRAAVPPPEGFLGDRTLEMAAKFDDAVWLFARLEEGHESAYRQGGDLLVQLVVVQGYPVVLLALVEMEAEGRPFVRRVALDPHDSTDRAILEALRSDFEATVALFGPSGRFERTVEVAAPRRVNVAMILERVARSPRSEARTDAATAKERALAAPPPVAESEHPFVAEPETARSAADAANALARLVAWSTPQRLDRVLLALSVPRDVVDAAMRKILTDAVDRGLALTPELTTRALAVGVAPDLPTLIKRQIERFRETTADDEAGGLSPSDVADNWEALLEAAGESDIPVDGVTHERAWNAIRRVRGEGSSGTGQHDLAQVDPEKLPEMGKLELVMLLDHPKLRHNAALELAKRSDPEMLETLYKAVRKMPRGEVVKVVPKIVGYGEVAGDALIDGLSARKTFVRQASALGLGELKLRRAVVPLAHALLAEDSDVWPELARVLGSFGSSAFRQVTRSLKDPKGQDERLKVTLAHLSNHGCESKVEALTRDSDKGTAVIALEAMTLRHDLKRLEDSLRSGKEYEGEDAVLKFSNRFYRELQGDDPPGVPS